MEPRKWYLYPPGSETEEDLRCVHAAQKTLRDYGRRFRCQLIEKTKQLRGEFL